MSHIQTFEELVCWKACREVRLFIFNEVINILPANEKFRISDQISRSSRSTSANIAEGYGRFHYLDNAKFCSNSRGSLWETLDHLITAKDENLISEDVLSKGRNLIQEAAKITNGYINYLQKAHKQSKTSVTNPDNQ